ncbi:MAG TPA: HlyC/CorC family transporter, partial [Acholeplasmataceae bacterium]|nr:HlyC/CorC family transporter [Acholeplasmataceae bacterium]
FFTASIITILLVALIINVFCKVLPKQKARINPEKIALENANIIYFLDKLLVPFTFILLRLRRRVLSDQEASTPKVTEEELESIIDTMETEGVFDEEDAELIQSAIGLNERTVYDIMTPRVDVVAIEESMDVESIKESFFEHQFSRVPVYKEDKDNIVGILSEKDFFTALIKNEEIDLKKLVSKPIFVSESTKVNDLIKEFQKLKKHFAIVVDEYGGTSGIVTMEDALEELVGEIYDEYDEEELDDLVVLEDNRYLVSPDMEIEDLFDYLNLSEKPDTQYNTIGGFVYSLIGGIPKEGMIANYQVESIVDEEEVTYNLEFTIKVVVNKRIRSLELKVDLIDIDSHNNKDKDTYE